MTTTPPMQDSFYRQLIARAAAHDMKAADHQRRAKFLRDEAAIYAGETSLTGVERGSSYEVHNESNGALRGRPLIFEVLRELGPQNKQELLSALRERGSKMSLVTLRSHLSKDERFKSNGEGMWGLAHQMNGSENKEVAPNVSPEPRSASIEMEEIEL